MSPQAIRVCLVDMNNGLPNQAIRCFKRLIESFKQRALAANPNLTLTLQHVQPRNLGELPNPDVDLVLSSGGPGSPYDGYDDPWCTGYRHFLDGVAERNLRDPRRAPQVMVVCHSFELSVMHFGVARMIARPGGRKFGIMPIYATAEGKRRAAFEPFGDRLFAFEHRFWEAVDPDEARIKQLGARVLARESRPGRADKGSALLAFDFAPGIFGTQFHPEADRAGVLAWVLNPEQATEFKKAYGDALYARMIKTLDDPMRVARTFALCVPGWLTDAFNTLAPGRGWQPLPRPVQDLTEFKSMAAAG